jgi:hypothetical protein
LALVALLVAVLAPAAMAAIQCVCNPCFGTNQRDRPLERKGQGLNDNIYGKARGDVIDASGYIHDHDEELLGRRGNDTLDARDDNGADTLKGDGVYSSARTSTSPNRRAECRISHAAAFKFI